MNRKGRKVSKRDSMFVLQRARIVGDSISRGMCVCFFFFFRGVSMKTHARQLILLRVLLRSFRSYRYISRSRLRKRACQALSNVNSPYVNVYISSRKVFSEKTIFKAERIIKKRRKIRNIEHTYVIYRCKCNLLR